MVEKGDQGLDETLMSSFEDSPLGRAVIRALRTPDIAENEEELDDDESESGDEKSQETADTVVVDTLKVIGLADYDKTCCLITLSQTVQGHTIYCGHSKASCSPPKHRILQRTPGRRGQTGVY
jgi:hypothetical protein